jgi:hypothetical protein
MALRTELEVGQVPEVALPGQTVDGCIAAAECARRCAPLADSSGNTFKGITVPLSNGSPARDRVSPAVATKAISRPTHDFPVQWQPGRTIDWYAASGTNPRIEGSDLAKLFWAKFQTEG